MWLEPVLLCCCTGQPDSRSEPSSVAFFASDFKLREAPDRPDLSTHLVTEITAECKTIGDGGVLMLWPIAAAIKKFESGFVSSCYVSKKICKRKLTAAAINLAFALSHIRIFDIFDFFSCHSLYTDASAVSKTLPVPPTLHSNNQKHQTFQKLTQKQVIHHGKIYFNDDRVTKYVVQGR